jgi:hypothetical protein
MELDKVLLEKVDALYFDLEELFYELAETKKFELTPYITKRLYDILLKYNNVKTELAKTYKIENIPRTVKYDPLEPMLSLIIDALTLVQSFYYKLLNGNIDMETLFAIDNIMSRIQRTICSSTIFILFFNTFYLHL